jgi:hypothetical protein
MNRVGALPSACTDDFDLDMLPTPINRPLIQPGDAIVPGQHDALAPSFGKLVDSLGIPLTTQEAENLRRALDSTGTLTLDTLPPATVWALDALWEGLSAPGAPVVYAIDFPCGMAIVPDGVRRLPHRATITLPHFKGTCLQGGQVRPLSIRLSIKPPMFSLHLALLNLDSFEFLDSKRPDHLFVSRHDEKGLPTDQQQLARDARGTDTVEFEQASRGVQQRMLKAARKGRGTNLLQRDGTLSKIELHELIRGALCAPVDPKRGLPLFHEVQQGRYPPGTLKRLVGMVLAAKDLPAFEREQLLTLATIRQGQPTEADRLLPGLVADILDALPDDQLDGVTAFALRHAGTWLLPRVDGVHPVLHDWVLHDPARFEDFFKAVLSQNVAATGFCALIHPSPAGRSVFHVAAAAGWTDAASALIESMLAMKSPERISQLLAALAMTTHDGDTLLWHAAARGEQVCAGLQALFQLLLADAGSPISVKIAWWTALLHIEQPRAAAAGIVRATAFAALAASGLDHRSRRVLEVLIDCLTCCDDNTEALLIHSQATVNDDEPDEPSPAEILFLLAQHAGSQVDKTVVERYLGARDRTGATALLLCTSRNQSGDVYHFVTGALKCPMPLDLSTLWDAQDHRKRTAFWAAIDAKALTAAAAFLNLAARLAGASDAHAIGFVRCIAAGLDSADITRLDQMLSARDDHGRGLLHILAGNGLHQALAFVTDALLARKFNQATMEQLWTRALRSELGGPSLLVEAIAHGKVLNGMLSSLMATKRLNEDGKQRLLATLLTMTDDTVDRKRAASPVLTAVNASSCSDDWKTAQRVLVDLLTRPDTSTLRTQLHVVAAMKSADIARHRLNACVQLLRKGVVSPDSLAAYLRARNQDGRTAFDEATHLGNPEVLAVFLEAAAADDPQKGPAVLLAFVIDSFDAADPARLLAADGTGRTLLHAVVDAGGGKALDLLMACLTGLQGDTDVVVDSLAAALASRSQGDKTLLWRLAPSGLEALSPLITALAETTAWTSSQKEALWTALLGEDHAPPKAAAAVLKWLKSTAGDPLPASISPALDQASQPARRQVPQAPLPELAPAARHYLESRHVDLDHVLHGNINPVGEAVGGHALMTANRNRLRLRPGASTTIHSNGTFTVDVDIKRAGLNPWIPKHESSTFFPSAWTRGEIHRQIASALRHGDAFATGTGPWDGVSKSGILMRFYRDPDSGRVTCFPLSG